VLLGKGALFSQLAGSVRRKGPGSLGLHADNSWFPAPFPEWEIMCTACFVTDDFTEESGATLVIPGSHKEKTHPPKDIRKTLLGAQPIVAPKGSICLWDGSVWHGNYPRQLDGERVVLHMTYTRLGMQPVETYDHLDDAWFAGHHPDLPTLLGRRNFLARRHGWKDATFPELLSETYRQAHGPKGY
jgi:ectoine hydroxylase-related dioxygenase (phytanoyl-CoA dioxygenase family)